MAQWGENAPLESWMASAALRPLLEAIFGNSPYLTQLLLGDPALLRSIGTDGIDGAYAQLMRFAQDSAASLDEQPQLMDHMRAAKGKLALLAAIGDITGAWTLEQVMQALSDFAELCLQLSLNHLLLAAHKRGEISLPHPNDPSRSSGIIVLAMGKLGGRELNYSSDIDLIVFFERDILAYKGRHNEQHFMNKLVHELVQMMQERTPTGYVFRTDIRLRPDPASTPPAIASEAALYYYEGVGQNWERAAMIKARPVAGDIAAGARFLENLRPFMWRRNLDFASINDIHSIKRQMDTRQSKDIQLPGHNIKIGLGGIREIEFYVQIHQLIWGGRQADLRERSTCGALAQLMAAGLVDAPKQQQLQDAYRFLRKLEHRLQMIADEQTHTLPTEAQAIDRVWHFMGYRSLEKFSADLMAHLHAVHGIFASAFRSAEKLGDEGNLVFTGVTHDPETLETIRKMGYANPETVSEIIMGWHHGSRRATRTKRARELLTELMPLLLKRLAETANPDAAFLKFNDFLYNLPAGVQLFSLFNANPDLLGLIADIMGSAPLLAELLSKSPSLMDGVLYADFYAALPSPESLSAQLAQTLDGKDDFEEIMNLLRQFKNEKQFQAGVQLLRGIVDARQVGVYLSDLADALIEATIASVEREFQKTYGTIAGGCFAVVALGKLGSREMTFSSDIDLVFIYDAPDAEALSDGEKRFTASVYYNRFGQRLLNAITLMGQDGRLYEVDTRLRPSGGQGQLATSVEGLRRYFDELAWTFEFMAFCKARVIAVDKQLQEILTVFMRQQITRERDKEKMRQDVIDMRERIDKEFGTQNPWDIKYVRGGIIDVDFIAQYLLLAHAAPTQKELPAAAADIFSWLREKSLLEAGIAQSLNECDRFLVQIFNMLRLCSQKALGADSLPPGLKKILCESMGEPDFLRLEQRLIAVEQTVLGHYNVLLRL